MVKTQAAAEVGDKEIARGKFSERARRSMIRKEMLSDEDRGFENSLTRRASIGKLIFGLSLEHISSKSMSDK